MKKLQTIEITKDDILSLFKGNRVSLWLSFASRYKHLAIKILFPVIIVFLGYYSCSSAQKIIHDDIQDIFAISDDIRSFYADKPDYWGFNTDFVVKNGLSTSFIHDSSIVLRHGSKLQIGKGVDADTVMPSVQNFDVILKDLTKAQCISYAETPLTEEQLLKVEKIDIVNQAGIFTFEWGGERVLPIKKYDTKSLCQDKSNTVIWTLK